jgi:hypothetical protein
LTIPYWVSAAAGRDGGIRRSRAPRQRAVRQRLPSDLELGRVEPDIESVQNLIDLV